jgi:hypothetical protein
VSQYLPPDDLFAAGSPAYGSAGVGFLGMYLAARLSTSNISSIWLPNTLPILARPMHGGYQSVNSLTGMKDYNAALHNSGTGTVGNAAARQPGAMVYRAAFGADVVVTGIFEMRALLGTAGLSEFAPRGVIARYQAGSLAGDGTALPELNNGSGYVAALYQKQSDSTFRLGVIKFVAGVPTVLGESVSIPTTAVNFGALFTITLNVTGTSIFATAQASGSATVVRAPTSGVYTDSAVAGSGRCGLMMGADREPTAGKRQVDLCHMLRVDESGVRKLQDEFARFRLGAAKRTSADITGTIGNYLSSSFFWDAGTFDESFSASGKTYTGARKLLRNATAGRVQFEHTTTDDDVNAGRLILSQRLADSQFSQHRKIKIVVPSAPSSGELWAGIVLRARQAQPLDESTPTVAVNGAGPNFPGNGTALSGGTGYMFVVRAKTSTQVIWQLHRIVNNSHFPIANFTENSPFSTTGWSYGGQVTLDFEIYPRNEGDPFGPVEMVCKVGATLVPLALTTSATNAGMFSPSTGAFVDPSTSRIRSNFGEGLVLANGFLSGGASSDIDPNFEAWEQGTLTGVEVLDEDQASVSLLTEGAAQGAALDTIMTPSELPITYEGWSISNPFDSGHRQTNPRFAHAADGTVMTRMSFEFVKLGAREAEVVALRAHWDSHRGTEIPFNFTPPGFSAPVKVHYLGSQIETEMVQVDAFNVRFRLESLE